MPVQRAFEKKYLPRSAGAKKLSVRTSVKAMVLFTQSSEPAVLCETAVSGVEVFHIEKKGL